MDQAESLPGEEHGRQRRAHPFERAVGGDHVLQVAARRLDRVAETADQVRTGTVLVERGDRLDRDPAGDFARGVTTHAIGDGEQARAGVHRVLVEVAEEADVAASGEPQGQRHLRSSNVVLPIRIGTPSGTGVGAVTLVRSR